MEEEIQSQPSNDRYGNDDGDDDYGDESFGSGEPEPAPRPSTAPAGPADGEATGPTTSERVSEFIKKSSITSGGLDDQRLLAKPLFDELLREKRLSEWNEAECVVWLSSIGLERYRARFFHHHISGKTLEKMTIEKLRDDIGIGALGHRELIMDEIEELKAKSSEFLKRLNKGRKEKRCGPHAAAAAAAAAAACCSPALRFPGRALLTRADGSQTTGEV